MMMGKKFMRRPIKSFGTKGALKKLSNYIVDRVTTPFAGSKVGDF